MYAIKKVRFETPEKALLTMHDSDCHSPRPFLEREHRASPPQLEEFGTVLPYSSDPVKRFESSNSSPYPTVFRTNIPPVHQKQSCWMPSDDLNLSLLDASNHEPRQPASCRSILKDADQNKMQCTNLPAKVFDGKPKPVALSSIENNKKNYPPNVLVKDNNFFIRRDNLDKFHLNVNPIQTQLNKLTLGKENDPLARKAEMMLNSGGILETSRMKEAVTTTPIANDSCRCHHCLPPVQHAANHIPSGHIAPQIQTSYIRNACHCLKPLPQICAHCDHMPPPVQQNVCRKCSCHTPEKITQKPTNAVDKKTWAIEKFEQSKQGMEVEKQTNVSKEKREPTVADLFKIIKLQNEQLQLLQEKVDKFISSSRQNVQPTITCSTEHVAVNTVDSEQHKMSIGVMTSFEMIRTSTVINKEVVKTNDNVQMQCNRSQISIKEVVSKPPSVNFLDGIAPVNNPVQKEIETSEKNVDNRQKTENVGDEKTFNELSLYNVQVDNATTPLMSPEQTLYLDVRDYTDSETSSVDQSNVGWTYYNKVMTHVNGMLQDSEMPSSASAMYRNMRQQCVQMHIDKTNVSVTKRVKFGDDPLGLRQPHIYAAPSTDTSLKMNQLAAKYLKNAPVPVASQRPVPKPTAAPIDMSFATRNYMEKHKILQGLPAQSYSPQPGDDIPRFLDITALKQQPKFL